VKYFVDQRIKPSNLGEAGKLINLFAEWIFHLYVRLL